LDTSVIILFFKKVEEFLADGVVVFYNFRRENLRETAVEIIKMRGDNHQKKIVSMKCGDKGIKVYPDKEIFIES